MALSYVTYTSDGSTTDYNVTFPFLSRDHVSLLIDGEASTAFTWLSDSMVRLNVAAANGLAVKLERTTPVASRLVDFQNGSTLDSEVDLNADSDQLVYLIQELTDRLNNSVSTAGINFIEGPGIQIDEADGDVTIGLFSALSVSAGGSTSNEVGSSKATVSATWTPNKAITAQELTGTGATAPALGDRAQTITGPFTTTTTHTITVHTASETASANITTAFYRKRHWGTSASTSLTTSAILALANSEFATSFAQTRLINPSSEYIYFAWPSTFGTPAFTVNGLANTAWTKTTVSHTNASGSTTNYDVYRSNFVLTGAFTIGVA